MSFGYAEAKSNLTDPEHRYRLWYYFYSHIWS